MSSKCYIYKHVVDNVKLQYYLHKHIPVVYKKCITKLRLSSIDLEIERGRYIKIQRKDRKCKICQFDIEDEFHFIFKCSVYDELRNQFIKPYFSVNPSVFKLIQLLSTENVKDLINLGKYICRAHSLRKSILGS